MNGGNLELNHSDVGAGDFAGAELWLEANNAFLIAADKEGYCPLKRPVLLVCLKCWSLALPKGPFFGVLSDTLVY